MCIPGELATTSGPVAGNTMFISVNRSGRPFRPGGMTDLMPPLDHDDLRALLDRSFGDGPAPTPLAPVLAAGHRVVRRRRIAAAGAGLATVLVIVGGGVVLGGADHRDRDATPPVATDGPDADYPVVPSDNHDFLSTRQWLQLGPDQRIETRPGVEVLQQVRNPLGLDDPSWSVGVVVRQDDRVRWQILDWQQEPGSDTASSGGGSTDRAAGVDADFEDWVRTESARLREQITNPPVVDSPTHDDARTEQSGELVRFEDDGSLSLLSGVELLRRVDDPFGDDDAGVTTVAIAIEYDDRVRWVVHSTFSSDDRVRGAAQTAVYADQAEPARFEQWVAAAAEQAATDGRSD